jgi:hypothetical protein
MTQAKLDCRWSPHVGPCRNPWCSVRFALDPRWDEGLRFAAKVMGVLASDGAVETMRGRKGLRWREYAERVARFLALPVR